MPNPIKYTTGSETLALKKGNFYIGTGDVGKGPSDTTGFYQGVSPSAGGYVIYMNKSGAPGDLSYHNAPTDAELISFTNNLAGTSYTTANECLVYFAGQTDKVVLNRDYESIVTDGLVLNLDAGFTPSYPKNGTTWYNVGGTNNGTLTNGPTFNSANGGSIVFDGVDDYGDLGSSPETLLTSFVSIETWVKLNTSYSGVWKIIAGRAEANRETYDLRISASLNTIVFLFRDNSGYYQASTGVQTTGEWLHLVGVFNGNTKEGKVYLNSILKDTVTSSNSTLKNTSNFFTLGGRYWDSQWRDFINADIPLTRLYNRALTAEEVAQNYNAQKGRFGL